jgi:hypothetical protein
MIHPFSIKRYLSFLFSYLIQVWGYFFIVILVYNVTKLVERCDPLVIRERYFYSRRVWKFYVTFWR